MQFLKQPLILPVLCLLLVRCTNYQWNYDGITAPNLNPVGVFSILQSNRKFYYMYTVTIVIHKSRSLIGTGGIAKFGPK